MHKSDITAFTKPEIDFYLRECNFTPTEEKVFLAASRGETIIGISMRLSMGETTTSETLRKAKNKVQKVRSFYGV